MKRTLAAIFLTLLAGATLTPRIDAAQDETSYRRESPTEVNDKPSPTYPEPRGQSLRYADVLILAGLMGLAAWVILKRRSRNWLIAVLTASLTYFGFYRAGCVCPIGAIQNVVLSLVDSKYTISIVVTALFLLPLLMTLFFGRVFCGGVCPLGACQDLMLRKPVRVPMVLDKVLRWGRWLYLAATVHFATGGLVLSLLRHRFMNWAGIFALIALAGLFERVVLGRRIRAKGNEVVKFKDICIVLGVAVALLGLGVFGEYLRVTPDFIICKYDPFVNLFRSINFRTALAHDWADTFQFVGPWWMWAITGIIMGGSIFIGRPYCRWLCPYGAILGVCSRVSRRNVTVMPDECCDCKLCDEACPFGAIEDHAAVKASCLGCARCYLSCPLERARLGLPVPPYTPGIALPLPGAAAAVPPAIIERSPLHGRRMAPAPDEVDVSYVDELVAKFGRDHAAALPILQAVQGRHNYLPHPAMQRVAALTELSMAELVGLATFYNQFRLAPIGKHLVKICCGTACHVSGATRIRDSIRLRLNLTGDADTDAARQFTVQEVACVGCCSLAPVMQVDDVTLGHLTPQTAPKALESFTPQSHKRATPHRQESVDLNPTHVAIEPHKPTITRKGRP